MPKRVHVIINPAAGQDRPILSILNTAFQETDIHWDVSITRQAGDAKRLARELAESGVDLVAAYGGDGTITEVAAGLMGTNVPLAVFPGGTANAIAWALGIPTDLTEAIAIAHEGNHIIRTVDMGQIDDRHFLVAIGIGLAGAAAEGADRSAKDRLGPLAYARAMLQALSKSQPATYRLTIDGREEETKGVTCVVANSGNFGLPGLSLSTKIDMSDGLLDVIVLRSTDIESLVAMAASIVRQNDSSSPLEHWQGREIKVIAEPFQAIQADGEVLEPGEVRAIIHPGAAKILVPKESATA